MFTNGCVYKISSKMFIPQCWLLLAFSMGVYDCWDDLNECHDDFTFKPPDGILRGHNGFNWLGFLRYVHVELGIPHPTSAPRVVLVHRQFVLAVANDVIKPPRDYKVNHIVFGKYERTEIECDLKQFQANMGMTCGPAYIETPYSQIVIHPEHSRFGVRNSLVILRLLRPMKSEYMVPICLPTLIERQNKRKDKSVMMIDYTSQVPENVDEELMAKKTLTLVTQRDCEKLFQKTFWESKSVSNAFCTSGCGVRAGTPIIIHSVHGPFELIGLAISSCKCLSKQMRSRINQNAPIYIDVYPYVTWITNVIMAQIMPNTYSLRVSNALAQGISGRRFMQRGRQEESLRSRTKQKEGWIKRIYKVGNYCFKKRASQQKLAIFYIDEFEVFSGKPTRLRVFARISAGVECTIVCARIELPNRITVPKIDGVGGYNITIQFRTEWFPFHFFFRVALMGMNTTGNDLNEFLKERPEPSYWFKKK